METTTYMCTSKLEPGAPLIGEAIHVLEVRSNRHSPSFPHGGRSPPPHTLRGPPPSNFSFSIELLDIYTLDTSVVVPCSSEELLIQALAKNGYLGNTPMTPSLAISFRTLELFWRIRLRKSSFSVEAFTKVICDMYSVRPCS